MRFWPSYPFGAWYLGVMSDELSDGSRDDMHKVQSEFYPLSILFSYYVTSFSPHGTNREPASVYAIE